MAIARRQKMFAMLAKLQKELEDQLQFEWPGATLTEDKDGITIELEGIVKRFEWSKLYGGGLKEWTQKRI